MANNTKLNFGKLTNEELISLLAITKEAIVGGSDYQIENWNILFNEASEQLKQRLDKKRAEVH